MHAQLYLTQIDITSILKVDRYRMTMKTTFIQGHHNIIVVEKTASR